MIYVEFIERDRWMPAEIFHQLGDQETSWVEGAVDRMVLQLGRTLRLGPRPSYLCLWEIPDMGRLDAWESYFQSAAAGRNRRSRAMHRAINIDRAGLYDVLHRDSDAQAPIYLIEYCEPRRDGDDDIRAAFAERSARHTSLRQLFLLRRIGHVGPDPALISIWGSSSYLAAEPLIRAAAPMDVQVVDVGFYRRFGEETL